MKLGGPKAPGTWSDIVGYCIIVAVMVAGFAYVDASRQHSTDEGRRVLCSGIIANTNNVARNDPFVIETCRAVGVDRDDYPDGGAP